MSEQARELSGPDLGAGVALATVAQGTPLLGHAQSEPVVLVRRGDELFAVASAPHQPREAARPRSQVRARRDRQ